MSDLEVRRVEPADEDAVWGLHVRALSAAGAYDEEFAHLDADIRRAERAYLEPGGEFLVGELAGAIVAMGAFQPLAVARERDAAPVIDAIPAGDAFDGVASSPDPDDVVVLRRMRVDPDHQRRGFGTAVLRALESRALECGFEYALLDTTTVQEAAIAFYERHGYAERDRQRRGDHEILFYGKDLR